MDSDKITETIDDREVLCMDISNGVSMSQLTNFALEIFPGAPMSQLIIEYLIRDDQVVGLTMSVVK